MSRSTTKKGLVSTKPRNLIAYERKLRALELRKSGLSWPEVAEKIGFAEGKVAFAAVRSLLNQMRNETQESIDEYRQIEVERLNQMQVKLQDRVDAGDPRAIETCVKLVAQRSKLLGLDAPIRTEISGPGGGPIELADARQRLADAIARVAGEAES